MASRRQRRGRGSNQAGNSVRTSTQGTRRQLVPRPTFSLSEAHFQSWVPLARTPVIKKGDTSTSARFVLNANSCPAMASYLSRHQYCQINSIGARFKPASMNQPGLHATLVYTVYHTELMTIPATFGHQWMKQNGAKASQFSREGNAPPSNSGSLKRPLKCVNYASAEAPGTIFGEVLWCREGNKEDEEDNDHPGEIELYFDVMFYGIK